MELKTRARRYSTIISLIFAQQSLNGQLKDVHRAARYLSFAIRLSDPMQLDKALKLAEPLALSCNVTNVLSQRIEGLVTYQVELPAGYWQFFTRADLPKAQAVGLAEQRKPIEFILDPPHSLVAGSTGSGKTETLKSVLISLIQSRSVDQLGLILIDPHRELSDFENEAHLIMPIAYSPDEIENALRWCNRELAYRKAENIKDGRIIVIGIDEGAADEVLLSAENLAAMKSVSEQARKYGMHLILGTQKPNHKELPNILDKLLNRFIGQLSDAGTSARVTGHAGLMAHKLTGKGDFLHVTGADVSRFQVAMATESDFDSLERTEVQPVTVQPEIVELPAEIETPEPGRPALTVQPDIAALYFHNANKISRAMAKDQLNLTRTSHELHRDFIKKFNSAYAKLLGGCK